MGTDTSSGSFWRGLPGDWSVRGTIRQYLYYRTYHEVERRELAGKEPLVRVSEISKFVEKDQADEAGKPPWMGCKAECLGTG